jgi:hypothetical protein
VKKSIKITLLLLLAIAFTFEVQAQGRKVIYLQNYDKAPYHFGFLLGANFMDYNLMLKDNYQDEVYTDFNDLPTDLSLSQEKFISYQILEIERSTKYNIPRVGFSVGVIGDLRLTDALNLRLSPTFSLSEINYGYTLQINQIDGTHYEYPISHNPYLTCLEFPLHIKYRSKRYNNVAAYLITGLNPKLYFSFKRKNQNFNWLKNKTGDLALEMGTGFDIYNQWFKMGVEFKFAYGLLNAMSDGVFFYHHPINGFKNKQFQLSFTFE